MIKFSVFYPDSEGKTFDMDYYCHKHIPLVRSHCGDALKNVSVEQGLAGLAPGAKPDYLAMGHLYFDSLESFQSSFVTNMAIIVADVPNFTNIAPTGIISEVKI